MFRSFPLLLVLIIVIALTDRLIAEGGFPITKRVEDVEVRQDDGRRYRLPNDTRPESYDITLTTRIDNGNFSFEGNVRIGIFANQTTSLITLHQRQLTIVDVRLTTASAPVQQISVGAYEYDTDLEFLRIPVTGAPLTAGTQYFLDIDYIGTLRQDNAGFYRSSYTNDNGTQIWQAATQFESTNARHGFPCYDEPQIKAVITVTINHGSSYRALSNMPVTAGYPIDNLDGTSTTRFDATPRTSTYLMAFVVSDFIPLESPLQGRVPHRVFARPNAINQSYLILDAGVKILDQISDYLGIEYSLPKMDQVAVPDFGPGAMENWGLVTYREVRFFYDDAVTEYYLKTAIITVIAHEFGHQWFGNLVGPRWWTYIWLNEGFANLFEHVGTNLVYPEWRILDYYVVDTLQNVFQSDALESTRPMTHYVESPPAVSALFDNIAYAKSGCVLRMFLHALSEPTFVKGLNKYLLAKSYSDAAEEDLFDALQQAAIEDNRQIPIAVPQIMSSWTRQKGFPVLTVERAYNISTIVTISQQRYLQNQSITQDPTTWWIPYNIATASSSNFSETAATHWLAQNTRSQNISVAGLNESDWLIVNKQETGYYRVKYDLRNYKLIADALFYGDISRIHPVSRAQLLDDAFNFARTERLSFTVFFDLARFLAKDIDYVPWAAANTAFTYLDEKFAGHANHHVFRDFVRKLSENIYDSLGIDDIASEPHLRKYARALSLKWACGMGSTHCQGDTLSRLRRLSVDQEFHQNVRPEIYCGAISSSTKADIDLVWARLLSSTDSTYRNMLINALACTTSNELLSAYLNTSLVTTNPFSNVTYRPDELVRVFNAVYQSGPLGLRLAIRFLSSNANASSMAFGNENIVTIYTAMAQRITNHTLHALFDDLTTALGRIISSETSTNATAVVLNNIAWTDAYGPVIDTWLKENHSGAATVVFSILTLLAAVLVSFARYF